MASSKAYLEFVLQQLSGLEEIDNSAFLTMLFNAMYPEVPAPQKK